MGLRNAPATFQAMINSILNDCINDLIVIYLDYILTFSDRMECHLKHLKLAFTMSRRNELYIGKIKFELMLEKTLFIGLTVGRSGVKIGDEHMRLVKEWPTPKSITEIPNFLGLVQIFWWFVKDFSKIAAPLTNLTRKHGYILKWDRDCYMAFTTLQEALDSAPIMQSPDWTLPVRCHKDAS